MADEPKLFVCVAPDDLRPQVDPLKGSVIVDERRACLSAPDAAAVEHALRMGEAWGLSVVAVTVGPAECDAALAEVSALGVAVRRVDSTRTASPRTLTPTELAGDPRWVAAQLAAQIRSAGPAAMVLCGDRSARHGVGAVPGLLAAELGMPHALGLVEVQVAGELALRVDKRLDGGWRERIAVDCPSVLSVEAAGVRLRRADLGSLVGAPPTVAEVYRAVDVELPGAVEFATPGPYRPRPLRVEPPAGSAHERLVALAGGNVTLSASRVTGPLEAEEAAGELIAFLSAHGYLAGEPGEPGGSRQVRPGD